ncbi:MAG: hypothetical protein H7338_00955 [Candidatus Sericytochromatia bacterium]|nr:hypothetical protein [Candidatus Sericytochromatia bacterium]
MRPFWTAALAALVMVSGLGSTVPPNPAVPNLAHLDWLRRSVRQLDGHELFTWQIYASPVKPGDRQGPFRFVGDEDEGIGCVDDVARAALVYFQHFEQTGQRTSLENGRKALAFIRSQSAGDGTYWNFIWADGRPNKDGPTSKNGLNWWTMRALWATATGLRTMAKQDPGLATLLRGDLARTVDRLERDQQRHYGQYTSWGPHRIPAWFLNGAPDVTAVAVLGLCALYETDPSPQVARLITRYAEAIAAYQLGDAREFPYYAHPPSDAVTHWHGWGCHTLHALALAGRLLHRADWIHSARLEADHFTTHLLINGGPINGFTPAPQPYPQIAYNVTPTAQGLLALYDATQEARYGQLAALQASWLYGNNPAGLPMTDATTGRVWDGIDPKGISGDSGAESTIEGLLTQLAFSHYPGLSAWLNARETARLGATVLEAEACVPGPERIREVGKGFSDEGFVSLKPGDRLTFQHQLVPGDYLLSPVFLRERQLVGEGATLQVTAGGLSQSLTPVYPQPGAPWNTMESGFLPNAVRIRAGEPITLQYAAGAKQPLKLDGIVAQPLVEHRILAMAGQQVALLKSFAAISTTVTPAGWPSAVTLPPGGSALVTTSGSGH